MPLKWSESRPPYTYSYLPEYSGFPSGSVVMKLSAKQEMQVRSLGQKDPLKEEMAADSSSLAWEIPWTEEPDGLQSMGSQSQAQIND